MNLLEALLERKSKLERLSDELGGIDKYLANLITEANKAIAEHDTVLCLQVMQLSDAYREAIDRE